MKDFYSQREQEQGKYTRQESRCYSKVTYLNGMAGVYEADYLTTSADQAIPIDLFKMLFLGNKSSLGLVMESLA